MLRIMPAVRLITAADPMPCRTRKPSSIPKEEASAAPREATPNSRKPPMKTRLKPSFSPSEASGSSMVTTVS